MNLQAGFGRTIYFTWLFMTLVVSLICDLGLASGSIGGSVACVVFCTLPLLVGIIGIASASKFGPIGAMIGTGSMVTWIILMSASIIREAWWWLYFAINVIQLILAAYQFRQLSHIQREAVAIAQSN